MHSKNDNTEFITYDNANDVVDKLFESLLSRYQIDLEIAMRGFLFEKIQSNCSITNVTKTILNVVNHLNRLLTG